MRRTDDHIILKMKEEGKTGKEIAKHFGVSAPYICKRLKRLKPVKQPESFEKLSTKQKKFVLAKAEGRSNVDAALASFDVTTRDSAKTLGHAMMKDPDVGRAIQEIMSEEGLTRRHIVRRLKDLVDHPDGHVSAKGIDIANKMTDGYSPIKVVVDIELVKQNVAFSEAERDRLDKLRTRMLESAKHTKPELIKGGE